MLGLAAQRAEIGRDQDLLIRHAGALGVATKEKVRRLGDEGAAFDGHHTAGHHEVVEKGRGLVHAAVTIGIGEQRDAASRVLLRGAFEVAHVAAHLDDEQPALVVEADGHRRLDHRFAGNELDAEAGREFKGLQFLFGGEGGGGGQGKF